MGRHADSLGVSGKLWVERGVPAVSRAFAVVLAKGFAWAESKVLRLKVAWRACRASAWVKERVYRLSVTGSSSRPLVLVVEDEPMIMLGAVQLFETAGFEALVAFSSDEAVAHLEGRDGVSVAFIEYDVPGALDGPQLAAAIRNRWPTVEIIVVSRPRPGHMPDLPLGARYFEKPYTHSEINRALDELGLTGELPRARVNVPPRF